MYNVMSAEACLLLDNTAKYMKESTQARAQRIMNETARTPSIMVYATFITSYKATLFLKHQCSLAAQLARAVVEGLASQTSCR